MLVIDGPAGAGKTTLAAALALLQDCVIVPMDLLYDGWEGLEAGVAQVERLLADLDAGRTPTYRRYDWIAGAYTETVTVPATPLLVIEGVGSGGTERRADCLVWIDAPADVRRQRAEARGDFADQWERWAEHERAHFKRRRTRDRADLILDSTREDLAAELSRTGWFVRPGASG